MNLSIQPTASLLAAAVVAIALLAAVRVAADDAAKPATPDAKKSADPFVTGDFHWKMSGPLVAPAQRTDDPCHAIKDPSIVFSGGKWHLFCTIRSRTRTHQVEYLSFADWKDADKAPRHVLKNHATSFCAPQVFYFAPQKKWYMICQASDESWEPKYGAAFATTETLDDPASWTPLKLLGHRRVPDGKQGKAGLDFWVICDDAKAHLFFTTLDGHMWREETPLKDFPHGWSEPQLAVKGDIFEAGHVYRLAGRTDDAKYLAMIEAQNGRGWRYFKAYKAAQLEGPWRELAATKDKAFASMANVTHPAERWTDVISHGELLRSGVNQTLTVDPSHLKCVFQGVTDQARAGKGYGDIPWRLGLLEFTE